MDYEPFGKMVFLSKEASEKFKDATDEQIDICAHIIADNINESLAKIARKRGE